MPVCTWLGNTHTTSTTCIHRYADRSPGYYTTVMVGELVGSIGHRAHARSWYNETQHYMYIQTFVPET